MFLKRWLTGCQTFKYCVMAYSGIQSPNDPCYIYFLITMTYFVKVTRLNSTDYTIRNMVNDKIKMHDKYARNKPRAVGSSDDPVRANGGKPIALLLVSGLIPHNTRLLCILSTFIPSPQQSHFKHTALVSLPGEPTQKSGSTLIAAPPHKAAMPLWPIRSTSVFKAYLLNKSWDLIHVTGPQRT